MNINKRILMSLIVAVLMAGLVTSVTFAFDCNNPNLNDNALLGEFSFFTGQFTLYKSNGSYLGDSPWTSKFNGAWVKLITPWGDYNVLVKTVLPDGAMNAGPGEVLCDGIGIDSLEGCLANFVP